MDAGHHLHNYYSTREFIYAIGVQRNWPGRKIYSHYFRNSLEAIRCVWSVFLVHTWQSLASDWEVFSGPPLRGNYKRRFLGLLPRNEVQRIKSRWNLRLADIGSPQTSPDFVTWDYLTKVSFICVFCDDKCVTRMPACGLFSYFRGSL